MNRITDTTGGWKPYILVILLCGLCCLTFSPLVCGIGYDREVYRYIGMLVSRGGVPYRDVFDHKPPLIYFVSCLGHLLRIGPWGYWVVMTMMAGTAACFVYRAASAYLKIKYAWLLTAAWSMLISFEYLAGDMGNTRLCSTSMTVCCAALFFFARGSVLYLGQGIFAALVFWFQPNEILPVLPILLWSMVAQRPGMLKTGVPVSLFFGRAFLMLAGALLITAPILIYAEQNEVLDAFIYQAFFFNFTEYTSPLSFSGKLRRTVVFFLTDRYCRWMGWLFLLNWLAVLALTVRYRGPARVAGVFVLLTGLMEGASVVFSGFSALPYFLCFASSLLLLLAYLASMTALHPLTAVSRKAITGVLGITGMVLVLNKAYHVQSVLRSDQPQGFRLDPALLQELRQVQGRDYQLYAFRSAQSLAYNTALDIKAPTRWIYTHFYGDLKNWDTDGDYIREIMTALDEHQCRYLIDYSQHIPLPYPHLQALWDDYVRAHYVPVMPVQMLRYRGMLYKRNSPAEAELP